MGEGVGAQHAVPLRFMEQRCMKSVQEYLVY